MKYNQYQRNFKETMVKKFLSNEYVKINIFTKENGIPESSLSYCIRTYQNC